MILFFALCALFCGYFNCLFRLTLFDDFVGGQPGWGWMREIHALSTPSAQGSRMPALHGPGRPAPCFPLQNVKEQRRILVPP
jgi:hypothetical protein